MTIHLIAYNSIEGKILRLKAFERWPIVR